MKIIITEEEINKALRAATIDMAIIPMLCGSSFKNKGVEFLLDAVCKYFLQWKKKVFGNAPDQADLLEESNAYLRKPSVNEPFAALDI